MKYFFSLVFCCLCSFHCGTNVSGPFCFAHQVLLSTAQWGASERHQGLRDSAPKILLVGKQELHSLL